MRTLIAAIALFGCIIIDDSSLTIRNRSNRVIEEVHLAGVHQRDWGPDLLRGELLPGEALVIDHIDCGNYDVLVVDGAGPKSQCVLPDLHMCFDDAVWTIDDETFSTCIQP